MEPNGGTIRREYDATAGAARAARDISTIIFKCSVAKGRVAIVPRSRQLGQPRGNKMVFRGECGK